MTAAEQWAVHEPPLQLTEKGDSPDLLFLLFPVTPLCSAIAMGSPHGAHRASPIAHQNRSFTASCMIRGPLDSVGCWKLVSVVNVVPDTL